MERTDQSLQRVFVICSAERANALCAFDGSNRLRDIGLHYDCIDFLVHCSGKERIGSAGFASFLGVPADAANFWHSTQRCRDCTSTDISTRDININHSCHKDRGFLDEVLDVLL